MKNCQDIEQDLSALIDGELPAERQAEVIEHVDSCPQCARRIAELQRLATGVATLPKAETPPQFLADVRRKIRTDEAPVSRWADVLFRPVWLKVPLEAVAVVAVIVFFSRPNPSAPVLVMADRRAAAAPILTARILPEERGAVSAPAPVTTKDGLVGRELRADALAFKDADQAKSLQPPVELRAELPATVVVRGETLVAVQLRADAIARSLHGRLDSITSSNMFVVHVPQSKVREFHVRLAHAGSTFGGKAAAAVLAATVDEQTASMTNGAEPAVDVKVIVEPAGK